MRSRLLQADAALLQDNPIGAALGGLHALPALLLDAHGLGSSAHGAKISAAELSSACLRQPLKRVQEQHVCKLAPGAVCCVRDARRCKGSSDLEQSLG